jgi:hypothetical protein
MVVAIVFLSILVIITGYACWNMLKKLESYEILTEIQKKHLQNIADIVGSSQVLIDTLDEKGIFQADDDVGDFFRYLKNIQEALNNFNKTLKNG